MKCLMKTLLIIFLIGIILDKHNGNLFKDFLKNNKILLSYNDRH